MVAVAVPHSADALLGFGKDKEKEALKENLVDAQARLDLVENILWVTGATVVFIVFWVFVLPLIAYYKDRRRGNGGPERGPQTYQNQNHRNTNQ